jgi:hypothetical protein
VPPSDVPSKPDGAIRLPKSCAMISGNSV